MANSHIIVINNGNTGITVTNSNNPITVSCDNNPVTVSRGTIINVQSGSASSLTSQFTCSEDVTAYQVLAAFGSTVRPATVTDVTHATNIIGLALTDCLAGETIEVVTTGRVTFAGWNWDDTRPVYLGVTPGEMLQDDPEVTDGATFSIRIGVVRDPTTIDVQILHSILY